MRIGDNIRQRTDGRFEARYIKGRDERGRAVYGYCYGKTLEEASRKREEVLQRWVAVREMNLLILGAGSHGREVRELAESLRVFRKIAFMDDAKSGVLGPCQKLGQYVEKYPVAIPAVGNRALRMRWMAELARAGFILPVLIHPGAMVSSSAEIGCSTVVCAQATVSAGAEIGRGCIISSGATVDRDVKVSDGTYIGCGQVVTADIQVDREGVLIYG